MKKETKIIIAVVAIIAVIAIVLAVIFLNQGPKTNLKPIESGEDLSKLIEQVYEGQDTLASLNTTIVDVSEADAVKAATGLENGNSLQYLAVSEPMISSQAYSFVVAKVKDGVDANSIAKEMLDKVNPIKWICVGAEKVYATSSGDVVCLVMASEEWAKPIYESFKSLAGTIGQEYERQGEPQYDDFPMDDTIQPYEE